MNSKTLKITNQQYSLLKQANRTKDKKAREKYKKIGNKVSKELKISKILERRVCGHR